MAITDIFTIPTLISLGITLLLVGLVAMFFMQRLNEQNHKFASMLGLVTTMADELNYIRSRMQISQTGGRHFQNISANSASNNLDEKPLIDVSEDEEDVCEDDDDESVASLDDDDDESVASLDDESVESLDDEDDEEEFKESNIKKIDMGETLDTKFHCETLGEEDNDEPEEIQSEELEGDLESLNDDLEEDLDVDESDGNVVATATETETHADVNEEIINLSNAEFIKSIDISNLEESHKDNESFDYKKMSLPKLKSLVVEKGLATDSSKLKKNELLKLLESE
jgi:hypothetical protein